MKIQWIKKIAASIVLLVSTNCFAGVIVDVVDVNKKLNFLQSASWTHKVLDNGFVLGSAQSASVAIQLWDDSTSRLDGAESATIIIGVMDFEDGALVYNPVTSWVGSLGITSMALLNSLGELSVTVASSWGDFKIGNSTLTVNTANVPEPSGLLLLSLGLLGLVAVRKQK
jgi:hypothetical protein